MEKKEKKSSKFGKDRKQQLIELLIILIIGLTVAVVFLSLEVVHYKNGANDWCEVANLGGEGLNMLRDYLIEYDIKWEELPEITIVDCPKEIKGFRE